MISLILKIINDLKPKYEQQLVRILNDFKK